MSVIFDAELKIAAGFNNTAGLLSINSIVATGDARTFVAPMAWYNFSPGLLKVRLDQSRYPRGKQNTAFTFSFMTKNQWLYMSDTYCGGGYTGNVTIRTKLRDYSDPQNANAILYLPAPADTIPKLGKIGGPIKIMLVAVEVI